jgi:plasmid maintenance system antidote protein VapI
MTSLVPGAVLMNLQQRYDLRLAEKQIGAEVASLHRRADTQSTRTFGKTT